MRTYAQIWSEYVGETKYSPDITDSDLQWIEETIKRYTKEVQEEQIQLAILSMTYNASLRLALNEQIPRVIK